MGFWFEGPILGVDFETTGVDVVNDRIVQYCMVDDRPPFPTPLVRDSLVNPGVPIPAGASDTHGIFDADVQQRGCDPREAVRDIRDVLAVEAVQNGTPVGGMNLAFDLSMLHWECHRYGTLTVEGVAGRPLAPVLDLYVLDKHVDPYRKGSRKLADDPVKGPGLATHYGVPFEGRAHDAVTDTVTTVRVLRKLGEAYPEVGRMDPFRLTVCQVEWRAQQTAGLQQFLRRKNSDPGLVIDPCWPYCPDRDHIRS